MEIDHMDGDASSITEFKIPDNHPGINDASYIARRKMFFESAQRSRVNNETPPVVSYLDEELALWAELVPELHAIHESNAASFIWEGAKDLGLSGKEIPQLETLAKRLWKGTGFSTIAAEGLLPGKTYFGYWAKGIMPCTQFLRHASSPQYTPEPDIFHDVVGHVPPLLNSEYADLIRLFGFASMLVESEQELMNLVKLYWFTIEFGLIEEKDNVRILGAGILSSVGEMNRTIENPNLWKSYNVDEILALELDTTHLQESYFVLPNLKILREGVIRTFIRR